MQHWVQESTESPASVRAFTLDCDSVCTRIDVFASPGYFVCRNKYGIFVRLQAIAEVKPSWNEKAPTKLDDHAYQVAKLRYSPERRKMQFLRAKHVRH
jgi:hypothetical protein